MKCLLACKEKPLPLLCTTRMYMSHRWLSFHLPSCQRKSTLPVASDAPPIPGRASQALRACCHSFPPLRFLFFVCNPCSSVLCNTKTDYKSSQPTAGALLDGVQRMLDEADGWAAGAGGAGMALAGGGS